MEKQEDKQQEDEQNILFYELVVRQSALERVLLKNKVIDEKDLAQAQIECMDKLKEIIEKKAKSDQSGFIKYGESV